MSYPKTVDGMPILLGMTIYVVTNNESIVCKTVAEVDSRKVTYTEPDNDGYIGARLDRVYADKRNI